MKLNITWTFSCLVKKIKNKQKPFHCVIDLITELRLLLPEVPPLQIHVFSIAMWKNEQSDCRVCDISVMSKPSSVCIYVRVGKWIRGTYYQCLLSVGRCSVGYSKWVNTMRFHKIHYQGIKSFEINNSFRLN